METPKYKGMGQGKFDKKHSFSLLRPKEVAEILGCSIPTLYRRQHDEDFPPKVKISNGIVGWRYGDIEEYIESNIETNGATT